MNAILPTRTRVSGASISDAPVYFRYPPEIRDQFIATGAIELGDGTRVSAEEVWHYLTEIAPSRYPVLFDDSHYYFGRLSRDFTLPVNLKSAYLQMTMDERLTKARAQGHPIVFVQGGQPFDIYYAAGAIALRPANIGSWARRKRPGLDRNQDTLESAQSKQQAYNDISFEICNSGGYEHIQLGNVPVDLVAPITTLRCSDVGYGVEAHRHGPKRDQVTLQIIDYPLDHQKDKEWAVRYFADNLRRLVQQIDQLTGRTTTEDDLAQTIRRQNEGRRLAIEIAELWWAAPQPPTNGQDRANLALLGLLDIHGDPVASLSILREAKEQVAERVRQGHLAQGVERDPARLFVCGSCVSPNNLRTEQAGGIVVGKDDGWSNVVTLIDENAEPYEALARAALALPYEQSITERARWTVDEIRRSRADGVVFLYKWGCNTQSGVARALVDEINAQSGVPGIVIEDDMWNTSTEQVQNRINAFIEMVA